MTVHRTAGLFPPARPDCAPHSYCRRRNMACHPLARKHCHQSPTLMLHPLRFEQTKGMRPNFHVVCYLYQIVEFHTPVNDGAWCCPCRSFKASVCAKCHMSRWCGWPSRKFSLAILIRRQIQNLQRRLRLRHAAPHDCRDGSRGRWSRYDTSSVVPESLRCRQYTVGINTYVCSNRHKVTDDDKSSPILHFSHRCVLLMEAFSLMPTVRCGQMYRY